MVTQMIAVGDRPARWDAQLQKIEDSTRIEVDSAVRTF